LTIDLVLLESGVAKVLRTVKRLSWSDCIPPWRIIPVALVLSTVGACDNFTLSQLAPAPPAGPNEQEINRQKVLKDDAVRCGYYYQNGNPYPKPGWFWEITYLVHDRDPNGNETGTHTRQEYVFIDCA
jgi:hypothetical protein